jgi:GNAT superfamily N-acetyltransferase
LEPNQIVVRTASSGDAALIAGLGARTFRDTFAADNTEADMTAYLAGAFSVEIHARVREGAAPACVGGTRPLEIVRFYADAPWIGAGVGAALMAACLDRAPAAQCDVVWLDVWERNPRAVAFYKKWGFAVVGKQEFVLGDDIQHDLLMARPATPSH